MTFTVGETVVYPNHGAAVIEDIETRQIKGEDKTYLVLRIVAQNDLVVRVPACNLDLVGVRDVVDQAGLERVFDVLRAPHTEEPTNWSASLTGATGREATSDLQHVTGVQLPRFACVATRPVASAPPCAVRAARRRRAPGQPDPRRHARRQDRGCTRDPDDQVVLSDDPQDQIGLVLTFDLNGSRCPR